MHSRGCVTTAGSDVTAKRAPPTPAVSPRPPLPPHEAPKVPSVLGADLSWTVHARGLTQHVFAVALHGAWCSPGSAVFQPVSRLSSWLWLNSGPLSSKTCSREHTTALATTIKWWKQPRCPSTGGGSIIWVRAGQDQSRAEVRAGLRSEQGRGQSRAGVRAGLRSEQGRGQSRVGLEQGWGQSRTGVIGCCLLDAQGSPWAKREAGTAGREQDRHQTHDGWGCGCSCPRGEPHFQKGESAGPCPQLRLQHDCREMTEARDHTGQGTVTRGCRQALSRATPALGWGWA